MKQIQLKAASTERIDKYISQNSKLSRSRVHDLIKSHNILVNDQKVKPSYILQIGDSIVVNIPKLKPLNMKPEKIPLDIVYEDRDVIVVNKAQGMVVHPAPGHPDHTLVNALLYHTKQLAKSPEGFRPGIVHRIDKDTSGLLMIAKNDLARQSLEAQLAQKSNKREYLAIVHGNFSEKRGTIDAPIGRNPYDRKKMAVTEKGKHAVTHFEVIQQFQGYSFIKCRLETGRTHQIRVHMAYISHPLAGDPLYGPRKTAGDPLCDPLYGPRKTLKGQGQFLHAQTLGFKHPRTGEWMEFSVAAPAIFQKMLANLQKKSE